MSGITSAGLRLYKEIAIWRLKIYVKPLIMGTPTRKKWHQMMPGNRYETIININLSLLKYAKSRTNMRTRTSSPTAQELKLDVSPITWVSFFHVSFRTSHLWHVGCDTGETHSQSEA